MRLTADVFAQCQGLTDKFTLKFLIGVETSVDTADKERRREEEWDKGGEKKT